MRRRYRPTVRGETTLARDRSSGKGQFEVGVFLARRVLPVEMAMPQNNVDSKSQHGWHEHIPCVGQNMRYPLDRDGDTE